jgi:hypothetical protein
MNAALADNSHIAFGKTVRPRAAPTQERISMGKKKMRLATYLIQKKLLTVEQAQEVLAVQEKQGNRIHERFGRIAVKKGFISETDLNKAIMAKERDDAGF